MTNKSPGGIWRHMLDSVRFLSRLPVHHIAAGDDPVDFSVSAYSFPLAGLIIGLPSALALTALATAGLNIWAAAMIAIATQILVTGALHEDGLADVADGFWGGATRERKLEIMRDSAIGTYGTLALICSVLLRLALLVHVVDQAGPLAAAALYLAFESLSRLAILSPWNALPAARGTIGEEEKPGLSARYGGPGLTEFSGAALCALPAMFITFFTAGIWPTLVAFVCGWLAIMAITRLAQHHIGGHTGDVLGATQQVSLLGLYLGLTLAI